MHSRCISSLNVTDRQKLERKLWESQNYTCFICRRRIDLDLHNGQLEIDHIEPLSVGGKDDPSNFALTHQRCNRSKQASDLRVARTLSKFEDIKEKCSDLGPNHPNLSDVFEEYNGGKSMLPLKMSDGIVSYTLSEVGDAEILSTPLLYDKLAGMSYFFAHLPIQYLFYDDRINPRAIGSRSLHKLIEEFFKKRPQLHVSLGWAQIKGNAGEAEIKIFDGQHKAAAQVLLGARSLTVRVFVNPDLDVLLTTNTNAGTVLRQVAFDKSVQRHLGSTLYWERIRRYQGAHGKDGGQFDFSEKDLLNFFKGEHREVKRYILDEVRASITHNPENRLRDYIDFGGRRKEKPLSYSSIEKTFYSFFIYRDVLDTRLNFRVSIGENPRQLEKEQIMRLMNIVADEIFIGHYDTDIGTYRLEKQVQDGKDIPESHLRAFRMSREEVLYNWLDIVKKIIIRYFLLQGKTYDDRRLFEYRFSEHLWDAIRKVVHNLARLSVWKNRELSSTVFGGKQNYDFWRMIFETGRAPSGFQVMPQGINLDELLKE